MERAWGAPGVFSDSPCIDAPVWDNTTEQGIELLRWQAPLGSLPVGVNQYRTENAVPFNLTIPMVPPSTIVNVFCSIIEQGSPLVRCDASPFTFMLTYPYDTLPVFQALTGYTPGTFTMLSENPPNP